MDPMILVTKLFVPPTRAKLVPRPHLIERLNNGLDRKLTLLSAPAGFGKTTLVGEWVRSLDKSTSPPAIAWLSLDENDNDSTRFLAYLIAALRTVDANIAQGASRALQSSQPPPFEDILTVLINEIATIPNPIVLILDDYHVIEVQSVHDILAFLLQHLPPSMHLVIVTREDPPLPLARPRVRGQLIELRAADLRFTSSQAAEFLNQVMVLDLSTEDIAALEARTEGWIAGLQLAALSMQGREDITTFVKSFTGSHRLVLDYLIEEVLNQQSESIQVFLLRTSILNRLTGPLCDALTGQENGQETLEHLEQANLFIVPLDDERCWYRYHHLFADLLRQRLRQTQPDQVPVLHRRASQWYESQGFGDEAIDHSLWGADFERAADLIDITVGGNYEQMAPLTLQRWLAAMPAELVCARPHLCLLQSWNQFTNGNLEAATESLQIAEKLLDTDRHRSNPDRKRLRGRAATIRSFIASYNGDMPGSIQLAQQALEVLPEDELAWRSAALIVLGDAYAGQGQLAAAHQARSEALLIGKASGDIFILMIANLNLAETLRQQAELQQVIEICERQMKIARDSGILESAIVGWVLGLWGAVLAQLDELDRALELSKRGAELATRGRDVTYICFSNLHRVRVLFSAGDLVAAEAVVQKMVNAALESDLPLWASCQFSAWQARIWLAQGKLDGATQWAEERAPSLDGELAFVHEMEYVVLAQIMIAQGRLDEAAGLLASLLAAAKAGGRYSRVIELLCLQALTAQSGGDTPEALSTLAQALAIAEPRGLIHAFVDKGPAMARLLYEAITQEIAPEYVQRLIAAFPIDAPKPSAAPHTQTREQEWVEQLSKRELEVLQLIAEGLTNPEIGARLYLSPHTIKAHARSIYGKLGVNNRTQAVYRAQSLGLLPPS